MIRQPKRKDARVIITCIMLWLGALLMVWVNNLLAKRITAWILVPSQQPPVLVVTPSPTFNAEWEISRFLRLTGYKPPTAKEISPALRQGLLEQYNTIIDVGTFDCLDYTVPGFQAGYTVYSFELDPDNQARCLKTLLLLGITSPETGLTIIEVNPGEAPLKIENPKQPHIYFYKAGVSNKKGGVSVSDAKEMAYAKGNGQLPVVPLDEVIPMNASVFILKSDTQGHEYGVLEGAKHILQRGVGLLFIEFWPIGAENNGFKPDEALGLVYSLGYQCFDSGFHDYNSIHRPSNLNDYINQMIEEKTTKDIIGSWDDLVCVRMRKELGIAV